MAGGANLEVQELLNQIYDPVNKALRLSPPQGAYLPTFNQTAQVANYTASAWDFVLANTSAGGFAVTLPLTPATGSQVQIKNTGKNRVTVAAQAPDTLENSVSGAVDLGQNSLITYRFDGAAWRSGGAFLPFVEVRNASDTSLGSGGNQSNLAFQIAAQILTGSANDGPHDLTLLAAADPRGRSISDGVANGTTTLASASAAFVNAAYPNGDVGARISGTNIPANTTISAVVSATQVTLSQAATGSASGLNITIGAGFDLYASRQAKNQTGVFFLNLPCKLSAPPATTIAAGSDGQTLPQSTIYLASVLPAEGLLGGTVTIATTGGPDTVTYTGIDTINNALVGCTGGSHAMALGQAVTFNAVTDFVVRDGSNGVLLRLAEATGMLTVAGSAGGLTLSSSGLINFNVGSGSSLELLIDGTSHNRFTIRAPSAGVRWLNNAFNATNLAMTDAGDVSIGRTAPATTVTTGFPYVPVMAGAPTGVATGVAGFVPVVYDSTNHKIWVYDSGWKGVVVA